MSRRWQTRPANGSLVSSWSPFNGSGGPRKRSTPTIATGGGTLGGTLTATTNSGCGLLKDLFPPHLRLTGPDELLAPLQQHDIAGRPFILEGRLYAGDHMLYLTAVTVTEPQ